MGLLSAGCFAGKQVVTERATKEFRCPKEQVQVEDLSGNAYRVWACGYKAIYVCSDRERMCIKEAGSGAQAAPSSGSQGPVGTTAQPLGPPLGPPKATAQPPPAAQPGFGAQPQPPQPTTPAWQTPASGQYPRD
jgi:hypothetical protein